MITNCCKVILPNKEQLKIGLALSGGGFRAAAFHLGTFRALKKLGILEKIDVISCISGGSIIGAYYGLNQNKAKTFNENFTSFENGFLSFLQKNLVIRLILSFGFLWRLVLCICIPILFYLFIGSYSIAIIFVLLEIFTCVCLLYKIFPTTKLLISKYNSLLYNKNKLHNLPSKPEIIINTTNLQTGTLFTFRKSESYDSSYEYNPFLSIATFDTDGIEIGKAVACSTAFPYLFSPTKIELSNEKGTFQPILMDGGVYDNQGIYRLTNLKSSYKCDIVIVSDGSAPFSKDYKKTLPISSFLRMINVQMRRIKSVQFLQSIYENNEKELLEIGYFSLDWEYEQCFNGFYDALKDHKLREHLLMCHGFIPNTEYTKEEVINKLKASINYDNRIFKGITKTDIEKITKISTNLISLSKDEITLLSDHAAALTEIQIKLYCPTLIN